MSARVAEAALDQPAVVDGDQLRAGSPHGPPPERRSGPNITRHARLIRPMPCEVGTRRPTRPHRQPQRGRIRFLIAAVTSFQE